MTKVAWFFLALNFKKSLCNFVLRHFLSAFLRSVFADVTSWLNEGTVSLFVIVLVINGAWWSRADKSVLLWQLTRSSRSYENVLLQRPALESSPRKVSTLIDFTFLKEICEILKEGLTALSLQWTGK